MAEKKGQMDRQTKWLIMWMDNWTWKEILFVQIINKKKKMNFDNFCQMENRMLDTL